MLVSTPKTQLKKQILISSLAIAALSTTACAPVKDAQQSLKETFASDDPCSNNARNTGVVLGGILGAVIANKLGDDLAASMVGVAIGAGIGGLIGNDMDDRRCELHKISQKYKIPIQSQAIQLSEAGINPKTSKQYEEKDALGLKVNLQDTGKQFLTGSSKLTPEAEEYFTAIAKSYSPKFNDSKDKKQNEILSQRQILIIGHTDDIGDSNSNAILAEKRAMTVANIFAKQGIKKANIHYQGAGETQPIADNRTEAGRNKNRRAEILDLPDQASLKAYLVNRKPVVAYYRTTTPLKRVNSESKSKVLTKVEPKIETKTPSKVIKKSNSPWKFGGQQLTSNNASVSIGNIVPEKQKLAFSSFIGISSAQADTYSVYESSCAYDRPRTSRGVKSLETNQELDLQTKDYLPGLNKTVWSGVAGQHTLAITNVAVARDGSTPTVNPNVLFYQSKALTKNSKASLKTVAQANAYHGEHGVLYRLFFTDKNSPVQCMDIVMPNKAPFKAQSGYIIYPNDQDNYVATYTPSKL